MLQNIFSTFHIDKPETIDDISDTDSPLFFLSKLRQSWGKDCEDNERKNGRAGYCQFTINALSADQQLGEYLLDAYHSAKSLPAIQVVAVDKDPVASVDAIHEWIRTVKTATHAQPALHFLGADTNHSALSRFDSPSQNKYWITPLETQATAFVTDGTPLK